MGKDKHVQAALKGADWFVNTQAKGSDDANRGRFLYALNLESGCSERSSGWQTAFAVYALLSAHKSSGEAKYLEAARLGMDYIKTLQVLDSRKRRICGAFREVTPQTEWLHPRDALSAAWAMLGWTKIAKDSDALERAVLFADWMMEYAFRGDWPTCTVALGPSGRASDPLAGSFQSGGILFFLELYEATGDLRYRYAAERMARFYLKHFIAEDGEITCIKDIYGDCPGVNDTAKWPFDWQRMHQVNDDFGGISLAKAYKEFGMEDCKRRLSAYFKWLGGMANPDGSFCKPAIEVGSATVSIFLRQYAAIADKSESDAIRKMDKACLDYLLTIQQSSSKPEIDGAFLGMDNQCKSGGGKWINIRCTSYAVIALLGAEGSAMFPVSSAELE